MILRDILPAFTPLSVVEGPFFFQHILQDSHGRVRVIAPVRPSEQFGTAALSWCALGAPPHLVSAFSCRHSAEGSYLLTEALVDDEQNFLTLRRILNYQPQPLSKIIEVGLSIVRALSCVRSIFPDFVHGALSPATVVIGSDGLPRIDLPFLSFWNESAVAQARFAGVTPPVYAITREEFLDRFDRQSQDYAGQPPEWRIAPDLVSWRTDLFALGILLAEMLTGEALQRRSGTPLLDSVAVNARRSWFHDERGEEIESIVAAVNRLTEVWPDDRQGTLLDVEMTLSRFSDSSPIQPDPVVSDAALAQRVESLALRGLESSAREIVLRLRDTNPWSLAARHATRAFAFYFGEAIVGEVLAADMHDSRRVLPALFFSAIVITLIVAVLTPGEAAIAVLLLLLLSSETYLHYRTKSPFAATPLPTLSALAVCVSVYWIVGKDGFADDLNDSLIWATIVAIAGLGLNELFGRARAPEFLSIGSLKLCVVMALLAGGYGAMFVLVALTLALIARLILGRVEATLGRYSWQGRALAHAPIFFLEEMPMSTWLMVGMGVVLAGRLFLQS